MTDYLDNIKKIRVRPAETKDENCWHCSHPILINGKSCCDLDDHVINDLEGEVCDNFYPLHAPKIKSVKDESDQTIKETHTNNGHCWDCKHLTIKNGKFFCKIDHHEVKSTTLEGCSQYVYLKDKTRSDVSVPDDLNGGTNGEFKINSRWDLEQAIVNAGIYRLTVKGGGTKPLRECSFKQLYAVFRRIYGFKPDIRQISNDELGDFNTESNMIEYNEKLYDLKNDSNFIRLVDRKTGLIHKMYRSSEVHLIPKSSKKKDILDLMDAEFGY